MEAPISTNVVAQNLPPSLGWQDQCQVIGAAFCTLSPAIELRGQIVRDPVTVIEDFCALSRRRYKKPARQVRLVSSGSG